MSGLSSFKKTTEILYLMSRWDGWVFLHCMMCLRIFWLVNHWPLADIIMIVKIEYYEIAPRWMLNNTLDDKWTLVQVMAWYHQAIGQLPCQYWRRSMSSYNVTWPQAVKQAWVFICNIKTMQFPCPNCIYPLVFISYWHDFVDAIKT